MGNSTSTYMTTNCNLPHNSYRTHKIFYKTCENCDNKMITQKYNCNMETGCCKKYTAKIKICNKCNFTL